MEWHSWGEVTAVLVEMTKVPMKALRGRKGKLIAILLVLLTLITWRGLDTLLGRGGGQAEASLPPSSTFGAVRNVTYEQAGGVNVKLDVYMPDHRGRFPAIVLIHGGFFYAGDKCQAKYDAAARYFTSAGFVVYDIDYRLAPKDGDFPTVYTCANGFTADISDLQGYHFPAALRDAAAAVRWVRDHGAKYKTDPGRISCVGESAGGTLCYGLGTKELVDVQAGWSGATKLDENFRRDISQNYIGCSLAACPATWRAASPYYSVTSTSSPAAIYNSSNEVIPQSQADLYARALTRAGVVNREKILPGSIHGINYANIRLPDGKRVWRDTADFIRNHER